MVSTFNCVYLVPKLINLHQCGPFSLTLLNKITFDCVDLVSEEKFYDVAQELCVMWSNAA